MCKADRREFGKRRIRENWKRQQKTVQQRTIATLSSMGEVAMAELKEWDGQEVLRSVWSLAIIHHSYRIHSFLPLMQFTSNLRCKPMLMLLHPFRFPRVKTFAIHPTFASVGVFHLPYIKSSCVELSTTAAATYTQKKFPLLLNFPICSSCEGVPLESINPKAVARSKRCSQFSIEKK